MIKSNMFHQLFHRLFSLHKTLTRDDVDVEIFMCVPRIWWCPWLLDIDNITVGIKRLDSPWVVEAKGVARKQFFGLLKTTDAGDMIMYVAELAKPKKKEGENDRVQQEGQQA